MVIWSECRMGQYKDDDHREGAPYFSNRVSYSLPRRRITAPSNTIAPTHQTITGLGKDRFEDEDILMIISVVVTGVGFI